MTAVLAAALFTVIALLGAALFTLVAQLNTLRTEVRDGFQRLDERISELQNGLTRIEQKLDDHIATPQQAAHPAA